MENIYSKLALNRRGNECARTNTVLFPISEVCDGTVSHHSFIYSAAKPERSKMVLPFIKCCTGLNRSKSQRISKSYHLFKSYGHFALGRVCSKPAMHACLKCSID